MSWGQPYHNDTLMAWFSNGEGNTSYLAAVHALSIQVPRDWCARNVLS